MIAHVLLPSFIHFRLFKIRSLEKARMVLCRQKKPFTEEKGQKEAFSWKGLHCGALLCFESFDKAARIELSTFSNLFQFSVSILTLFYLKLERLRFSLSNQSASIVNQLIK